MPPPATIEAASNRASALYRHAIWNVTEVQEDADTQLDTTSCKHCIIRGSRG